MQAALRHVDDFLPAHNLVSLEQLADHLRALPARTRPVAVAPAPPVCIMELSATYRFQTHLPSGSGIC